MARPTTKEDLVVEARKKFQQLEELINNMTEEEQMGDFEFSEAELAKKKEAHWRRDQNVRDVLIHLYEWHRLTIHWIQSNQKGVAQPFLPEPYNWRNYGDLNISFVKKHQMTSLEEAKRLLKESGTEIMDTIQSFSNEELFSKGQFSWTGNNTIGSYLVSSTSSHYDWAIKKLRFYLNHSRKNRE